MLLGDVTVQLGDLVAGKQLGVPPVYAVRPLNLLDDGRRGFAVPIALQCDLAHTPQTFLRDGLDERHVVLDPAFHHRSVQLAGVVVIHQVDAQRGLDGFLPLPDAQLPRELCHRLDLAAQAKHRGAPLQLHGHLGENRFDLCNQV